MLVNTFPLLVFDFGVSLSGITFMQPYVILILLYKFSCRYVILSKEYPFIDLIYTEEPRNMSYDHQGNPVENPIVY